ncbi:MAG: hypothetical protein H7Y11_01280 [Armatimonadetes bacterium]|nr:hypothetical protein [Anaerolineae bacterium]
MTLHASLVPLLAPLYDTLITQLHQTQVVLLHPQSTYRSVLIAKLVNDPAIKTLYYALGPDDIDVQSFVNNLAHDLAQQHPTFGRHVSLLDNVQYENFFTHTYTIIEQIARDLSEISDQPFTLILDEYDRSDIADDVQRLIERLALYLPPQCHLLINSRTLPRFAWISLIVRNRAVMVLNTGTITENFYGVINQHDGDLEVHALGPGLVLQNNHIIDAWEGHLPRLLFFFALDRPCITRNDICHAFWRDLNAEQAVNVFHVTKRRLHKTMAFDVLVHDGGYYRINPALSMYYDVLEFASALVQGRNADDSDRITAYQRAIDLYRGPFLQGHDDDWIQERRVDFRMGYVEALQAVAAMWQARGKPDLSLTLLQKVLTEDLRIDTVNQAVMQLYAQSGRRGEAVTHYQRVMQDYQKDQLQPSAQLQQMYQAIIT